MAFTYSYANENRTVVIGKDDETGRIISFVADTDNSDHCSFLKWCEEGNTPEPYVAPEPPTPPTPEEKLAASGLTVDELKSLLGL